MRAGTASPLMKFDRPQPRRFFRNAGPKDAPDAELAAVRFAPDDGIVRLGEFIGANE
jgi:hypothetical protein